LALVVVLMALARSPTDAQAPPVRATTVRVVSPPAGRQAVALPLVGTQQRQMPSVIDSTLDGARRVLARYKLTPVPRYRDTGTEALDGRVFAQAPQPGGLIPQSGSTVALDVYRYVPAQMVAVPDVVGQPLLLAVRRLQGVRLRPQYPRQGLASVASATVSAQDPSPGTRVAPGTPVTLTVEVSTRVPWIVLQDVATATQLLARRGLVLDPRGSEYSDTVPTGRITRQHPDSGSLARAGDGVQAWTSRGVHPRSPEHTMPRLVGLTLDEAVRVSTLSFLTLNHVDTIIDRAGVGRIVTQRPAEGAVVHSSDQIDVQLTVPPAPTRVPWVVGLRLSEAEQVMKESGFGTRTRLIPGDGARGGQVIAQSVDSGLTRPLGTAITLTATDTFAQPVAQARLMPGVVGMPRAAAMDSLGILSPRLTIVEVETPRLDEDDRVVAQSPPSGTVILPELDVVLRVGRYVEPPPSLEPPPPFDPQAIDLAIVPSLVGRPMAEVREMLGAARLTLGDVSAADVAADSVVASQEPPAATLVAPGAAVSLTLQPRDASTDVPDTGGGGGGGVVGRFPWWVLLGAGLALGALLLLVGRRVTRPHVESRPADREAEHTEVPRTTVTLRPSTLAPPQVDFPGDRSVVASEITLVSPPPEVAIDFPDVLIAREEVHDELGQ